MIRAENDLIINAILTEHDLKSDTLELRRVNAGGNWYRLVSKGKHALAVPYRNVEKLKKNLAVDLFLSAVDDDLSEVAVVSRGDRARIARIQRPEYVTDDPAEYESVRYDRTKEVVCELLSDYRIKVRDLYPDYYPMEDEPESLPFNI